jgi:hypothetical protein
MDEDEIKKLVEARKNQYVPSIKKEDLVHGAYYAGKCRNATVARWDATRGKFVHWRTKFSHTFLETISCPEDEPRYDVFVTRSILENPEKEIPLTN